MSTKLSRLHHTTDLPIIIYHFFKHLLWMCLGLSHFFDERDTVWYTCCVLLVNCITNKLDQFPGLRLFGELSTSSAHSVFCAPHSLWYKFRSTNDVSLKQISLTFGIYHIHQGQLWVGINPIFCKFLDCNPPSVKWLGPIFLFAEDHRMVGLEGTLQPPAPPLPCAGCPPAQAAQSPSMAWGTHSSRLQCQGLTAL